MIIRCKKEKVSVLERGLGTQREHSRCAGGTADYTYEGKSKHPAICDMNSRLPCMLSVSYIFTAVLK